MMTFNEQFRYRTKELALGVIRWYGSIKRKDDAVRIMGRQLLKSITSVAANFRAACRSRSPAEYFAKLCIVVEEADESVFWLECFMELDADQQTTLQPMYDECLEILAVMASTRKKLKN